ncbi:hypothetical protein L0663_05300 [Dyadobacter sp. CY107]|uniref:hypothetical protein n=1 Tax=Dyadobacter fanqingshengii TaxID=2906443 RepID=UPI001F48952D|nr:hypothetical protein [Dyadobacter fanqingshengii]MCF2502783.1 hypothetical protein [Dyadobacter fanqingshengii]
MSNHTPTPYHINKVFNDVNYTNSEKDEIIARLVAGSAEEVGRNDANAEFIVRACNAHDDLGASLNRTWKIIEMAGLTNLMNAVQLGQMSWYHKAENAKNLSYAALAKAKISQ